MEVNTEPNTIQKKSHIKMVTIIISFCILLFGTIAILGIFYLKGMNGTEKQFREDISQYENGDYTFCYQGEESKALPKEIKKLSDYNVTIYENTKYIIIENK